MELEKGEAELADKKNELEHATDEHNDYFFQRDHLPANVDRSNLLSREDIVVDSECFEEYPCGHTVIIKGKKIDMDGVEIAKLFQDNYLTVPKHFREYLNFKSC